MSPNESGDQEGPDAKSRTESDKGEEEQSRLWEDIMANRRKFYERYIQRPPGVSPEQAEEPDDWDELNHDEMDPVQLYLRGDVSWMREKTLRCLGMSEPDSEPSVPEFVEWPALQQDVAFLLSLGAPTEIATFGIQCIYEQHAAGNYDVIEGRRPTPWEDQSAREEFEDRIREYYKLRLEDFKEGGAYDVLLRQIASLLLKYRSGEWQPGQSVVTF